MDNVPENELFSAYLDGELTAEEQAKVEKLLAASPAARQLLDELRALSTTLQSLPAHKLDEDLGQSVLRQAEREMLREPVTEFPKLQPVKTGRRPLARRFLTPRNLIWSGTAVAVAVLLTVNRPPEPRPEADRVAMVNEAGERDLVEESVHQDAEPAIGPSMRAISDVADEAAPMAEADVAADATKARPVEAPSSATPSVDAKPDGLPKRAMRKAAPAPRKKMGRTPPSGAVVGGRSSGVGGRASGGAGGRPGGAGGGAVSKKAAPAMDKALAPTFATKAGPKESMALDNNRPIAHKGTSLNDGTSRGVRAARGVLVVRCDISPKAARNRAFDRVLSSQKISLDQAGVETEGKLKQQKLVEANLLAGKPATGELDLIYAEATPGQIEGTLAALADQPDSFLSVSVEPDPGVPSQRPLVRYGRGRMLAANAPATPRPVATAGRPPAGKPKAAEPRSQSANAAKPGDVRQGFAQRLKMPQAPGAPARTGPAMQVQSAMQAAPSEPLQSMQSAAPAKPAAEAEAPADGAPAKAEGRPETKPQEVRAYGQAAPARGGMGQPEPDSERDNRRQIEHSQMVNGPGKDRAGTYRVLFVLRVVGSDPVASPPPAAATTGAAEGAKAKKAPSVDASEAQPAVKQ